jgi:thioredoxin reductase (NADPH)
MARFRGLGRSRTVAHGDVLFAEGDAGADFFVIESGSVAIVQGHGRENRVIAVFGPGTSSWASSACSPASGSI